MKESLALEERDTNDNEVEEGSDEVGEDQPASSAAHFDNGVRLPQDVDQVQRGHGRVRGRCGRCQPRALGEQLPADTAQHQGEINVLGTLSNPPK